MKELTLAATVENIETVTEFVNAQLELLARSWRRHGGSHRGEGQHSPQRARATPVEKEAVPSLRDSHEASSVAAVVQAAASWVSVALVRPS